MTAIALALGASLAWGLGDFLGGLKSRSLHVLTVLAISQVVGFAAVLVWLTVSSDAFPGGPAAAWAVSAAIPFPVGVASGERPGALQVLGILLALAGVALASREPAERGGGRAAGVGLALVAAVGFGLYFVFLDRAAEESVPWAVATARGTSSLLAVVAAIVVGASLRPGRTHMPVLVAVGLCDVGANVLFGLASTRGLLSVVSVLAALYPIVTVGLAALLLHERIAPAQRVGVAGALTGAALITAG